MMSRPRDADRDATAADGPGRGASGASGDIDYVDRLEERVRRRIAERREIESAAAPAVEAERRESLVRFRQTAVRRAGQFVHLAGDLVAGLAGASPRAGPGDDGTATRSKERRPAESYGDRMVRRWRGRVVVHRLQQIEDEILVRSAIACDVVDLAQVLCKPASRLPALVIGRFDRARAFLHGADARPRGLRCTVKRRPEGDLFSIRDAEGYRLPPLPPDVALVLLAHHRESDGRFRWAPVLTRVASKAVTTAALVAWNGDLVRRVRALVDETS